MTTGAGTAGDSDRTRRVQSSLDRLRTGTDVERTVFFSDAVFAIAMTLLVLELRVPELATGYDAHEFADAVVERIPAFVAFALSFFLVGTTWITHHRRFKAIVAYDGRLQLLNLLVLFFVAFMPVPSGMLFQASGRSAIPPMLYAATMAGIFLSLNALWRHAHRADLLDEAVDEPLYRFSLASTTPVWMVFLLSMPLGLWSTDAVQYSWIAIWPATTLYGRRLHRRYVREETARLGGTGPGS